MNPGSHPYQGSAQGLFPQDCIGGLRERRAAGDRWRPLGAAGLRWRVDQRWTRHAARGGSGAPHRGACLARQTPPADPDKRAPPGNRLAGAALAGCGPGTSPYIDGLSLVTGHGGTQAAFLLKPAARSSVGAGCSASGSEGRLALKRVEPGGHGRALALGEGEPLTTFLAVTLHRTA
jgi:hypothetical protein